MLLDINLILALVHDGVRVDVAAVGADESDLRAVGVPPMSVRALEFFGGDELRDAIRDAVFGAACELSRR